MSIRGDILNDLKTALDNISITNGFNQNVGLVSDDSIRSPENLSADELPALFLTDGDERKEPADVDSKRNQLEFIVTGIVKRNNDEDNIQARRRDLQNDVERSIMIDEKRGGKAILTEIESIQTDKAIFDNYTLFELEGTVTYHQNRNDPSSQTNAPIP